MIQRGSTLTFVVEHLDPELGDWSALEYASIAKESAQAGVKFCLSSVPSSLRLPTALIETTGFVVEHQGVEDIYASNKERVCLLDPAAEKELDPSDALDFDVFLFGGILGTFIQ